MKLPYIGPLESIFEGPEMLKVLSEELKLPGLKGLCLELELCMAYPVAIGLWLFQVLWLFMGNSLSWMAPKWLAMGILEPRKAE